MLQIAQDSGRLTVSYSRFEVDDFKGKECELALKWLDGSGGKIKKEIIPKARFVTLKHAGGSYTVIFSKGGLVLNQFSGSFHPGYL